MPHYEWINSSTIALIFFVVSIFLITKIKITKDKTKKVFLSFLILLM
jgi:peptidoglycan/LPS O-acetylase OafA/YrhL